MRFAVLGSGSSGNSVLVWGGETHILIDAGFSGKELARRLGVLGLTPECLSAIVVTHEHGDHVHGAGVMARRHGTPLYITRRTQAACGRFLNGTEEVVPYKPGHPFTIGDLFLEPFVTVHDAVDPVAFAVVDQRTGLRLGIATDLGRATVQVRHVLKGCDGLILESNHDEVMLWSADYPQTVKARIASSHGHLSNQAAAQFALELYHPHLSAVVLAHLSSESNTPGLARSVMGKALRSKGYRGVLDVAPPEQPTPLLDLVELRSKTGPDQLSLL